MNTVVRRTGKVRDLRLDLSRKRHTKSLTPDRLERVLSTLEGSGGSVLLLGEAESGKDRLAEETAYAMEQDAGGGVLIRLLPAPGVGQSDEDFGGELLRYFGLGRADDRPRSADSAESDLVERVLDALTDEADGRDVMLVAPSLDLYPPRIGMAFASLARADRIRVIGTARQLSGAAAQVARDPRVDCLSIGPLGYDEAGVLLARLLGGHLVEFTTLQRWYAITNGYAHSLTVLALALDRRGLVVHEKGMIWERMDDIGTIPDEFLRHLEEACEPDELETLEVIALAEPLMERVILEQLCPEHVRKLQSAGLIVPQMRSNGQTVLTMSHPVLTSALKQRMGAERRRATSERLFLTLREELEGQDPSRIPGRLARLVTIGIETDRTLPIEWLVAALDDAELARNLETRLRIALAIARHPDASPSRLADAAIIVCVTARQLGDKSAMVEAIEIIRDLTAESRRSRSVSQSQRVRMLLELVTHLMFDLKEYEEAFGVLSSLEREEHQPGSVAAESIRSARALLFAGRGQLRRAIAIAPQPSDHGRMQTEWARGRARLVSSLILSQRGRFAEAVEVADKAQSFARLGGHDERTVADELALAAFVAQWASGSMMAARDIVTRLQGQSARLWQNTGFIEAALAVLALSEGRWREASQRASRAFERCSRHDPLGISSLSSGILAYALAALGERAESRRAILAAEASRPGVSQMLCGLVHVMTLGARLWNEDPDVIERANSLVAWANDEELPYIELRALHLLATAQGGVDPSRVARARALSRQIDAPLGAALAQYVDEVSAGESAWDCPSARVLTDLGVWVPLPRTPTLSAREREIALHAALGYSSKWIAERFFLSTRTVETHLRHVFTKLGVTGRDELRDQLRGGRISA